MALYLSNIRNNPDVGDWMVVVLLSSMSPEAESKALGSAFIKIIEEDDFLCF